MLRAAFAVALQLTAHPAHVWRIIGIGLPHSVRVVQELLIQLKAVGTRLTGKVPVKDST